MTKLLQVKDLVVKFKLRTGDLTALNGISFDLNAGEKMGLVGESGAGKSVAGFSIINLISKPGYIYLGEILAQTRSGIEQQFQVEPGFGFGVDGLHAGSQFVGGTFGVGESTRPAWRADRQGGPADQIR